MTVDAGRVVLQDIIQNGIFSQDSITNMFQRLLLSFELKDRFYYHLVSSECTNSYARVVANCVDLRALNVMHNSLIDWSKLRDECFWNAEESLFTISLFDQKSDDVLSFINKFCPDFRFKLKDLLDSLNKDDVLNLYQLLRFDPSQETTSLFK